VIATQWCRAQALPVSNDTQQRSHLNEYTSGRRVKTWAADREKKYQYLYMNTSGAQVEHKTSNEADSEVICHTRRAYRKTLIFGCF